MSQTKRNRVRECYDLVAKIPQGKVTTYDEIGRVLGIPGYKTVGKSKLAMRQDRTLPPVPHHRVIMEDGKVGEDTKRLLLADGVQVDGNIVPLQNYFYKFQ